MVVAAKPKIDAETQFLDMVYRIKQSHEGFCAIFFRFSIIKSALKTNTRMGEVMRILNALSVQMRSFVLSDTDICLIAQGLADTVAQKTMDDIRALFAADPKSKAPEFAVHYHLEDSYADILALAQEKEEALRNRRREKAKSIATVPIEPGHLDAILKNIRRLNVLKVVRRQEAVEIAKNGTFRSLFYEYINSIFDLKQAVAPTVDMLSNRWLFQHLSETLDRRMLSVSNGIITHTPKGLSLNLNISTLFTEEFATCLKNKPANLTIYVEVQLMDVLQNTDNYFKARDLLEKAGCKMILDGLYPISFEFLDIRLFKPDFVKLIWSPALVSYQGKKNMPQLISEIGAEKFILSRAEGEESVKWGLTQGITRFQGFFIDSLSGAVSRRRCPYRNMCTLTQCLARKACIAGPVWSQCQKKEVLDAPMETNLAR